MRESCMSESGERFHLAAILSLRDARPLRPDALLLFTVV